MKKLRIIHFDVSQGESTLISLLGCGNAKDIHILIDGGRLCRGVYVERILVKLGIKELAYAICTHLDNDHAEGLRLVIESTKIKTKMLLVPEFAADTSKFNGLNTSLKKAGVKYRIANVGEILIYDKMCACKLEIIHVGQPLLKDDNPASIACLLTMNKFSYYTGGDLPFELEEELLSSGKWKRLPNHVCAFKCGHHGAETSTSKKFVEGIKPTAAFISAGRHKHSHPRQSVLNDLIRLGNPFQAFYATNCLYDRQGFVKEGETQTAQKKGLAFSSRLDGILGHVVLYTDENLSNKHDGLNHNFYVLRPWQNTFESAIWVAYRHVCFSENNLPLNNPLKAGRLLSEEQLPEFRLEEISTSHERYMVDDEDAWWEEHDEDEPYVKPSIVDFIGSYQRGEIECPPTPIHKFIEDGENFAREDEEIETNSGNSSKKRKRDEYREESGCLFTPKKAMEKCVFCHKKTPGTILAKIKLRIGEVQKAKAAKKEPNQLKNPNIKECRHYNLWYVCSSCLRDHADEIGKWIDCENM